MGEASKLTTAEIAKDRRLKSIYKMSLDEYNEKLAGQKFKCVLCGRPFTGEGKYTAYVDHDHKCCPRRRKQFCGKCNRGLLCYICNKWAVGLIEKMQKLGVDFDKALQYIKDWHTTIEAKGGYEEKGTTKRLQKKQKGIRRRNVTVS